MIQRLCMCVMVAAALLFIPQQTEAQVYYQQRTYVAQPQQQVIVHTPMRLRVGGELGVGIVGTSYSSAAPSFNAAIRVGLQANDLFAFYYQGRALLALDGLDNYYNPLLSSHGVAFDLTLADGIIQVGAGASFDFSYSESWWIGTPFFRDQVGVGVDGRFAWFFSILETGFDRSGLYVGGNLHASFMFDNSAEIVVSGSVNVGYEIY